MLAIVKLLLTIATLIATHAIQSKSKDAATAEVLLGYLRDADNAIDRANAARQRVRDDSELDEHDPYRRD